MSRAYLGLGSNVGDRSSNVRRAVALLDRHAEIEVIRVSSVYETEAMDDAAGQRDFYNAAVEVETGLGTHDLLAACQEIERSLGRELGGRRHAPRPIDVDLLLFDDLRVHDEDLVIPHPDITRRRFVMVPLLELAPELALARGERLRDALAALQDGQRVTSVGSLQPE